MEGHCPKLLRQNHVHHRLHPLNDALSDGILIYHLSNEWGEVKMSFGGYFLYDQTIALK